MNTATVSQNTQLTRRIQERLDARRATTGLALSVAEDGVCQEDGTMVVTVGPRDSNRRIRVYDYVGVLGEIEDELRAEGVSNVILLPALADDVLDLVRNGELTPKPMSDDELKSLLIEAQTRLDAHRQAGGPALFVPENGYRRDDGWIYVVVAPAAAGIRAYDYVETLRSVEQELRAAGFSNVFLVVHLE